MDDPLRDEDEPLNETRIKEEQMSDSENQVDPSARTDDGQIKLKEEHSAENKLDDAISAYETEDTNIKEELYDYNECTGASINQDTLPDSTLPSSLIISVCKDGSVVSRNDNDYGFSQVDFIPTDEKVVSHLSATGSSLRRLMRKYICNHCNYSTSFRVGMVAHSQKHMNPKTHKVSCSYCDVTMNSFNEYEMHVNNTHPDVKLQNCDRCSYSTNFRWSLNRHNLLIHDKEKSPAETFKCELCPFKSCYQPSLFAHMKRKHSSKEPYPCKMCDVRMKSSLKLRQHMLTEHAQENMFQCKSCDYICKTKAGMGTHVSRKHKTNIINEINSSMMALT